jgi:hypothetical protein
MKGKRQLVEHGGKPGPKMLYMTRHAGNAAVNTCVMDARAGYVSKPVTINQPAQKRARCWIPRNRQTFTFPERTLVQLGTRLAAPRPLTRRARNATYGGHDQLEFP